MDSIRVPFYEKNWVIIIIIIIGAETKKNFAEKVEKRNGGAKTLKNRKLSATIYSELQHSFKINFNCYK